jgi:O-antigen/teichoic acid export membrane protein
MGPILLAMADSERHLTKIYLIAVGSGVLLAIPLVWRFGAVGAAGAQIVSTGLIAYLSGRFARRKLGLGTTFMTGGLSEAPPAGA